MKLTVNYPGEADGLDELEAEIIPEAEEIGGGGVAMLTEHAMFIPLAPGDLVRYNSAKVITGVEMLTPTYIAWCEFHPPVGLPAFHSPTEDHRAVKGWTRTVEDWRNRGATVTAPIRFNAMVSHPDEQWLYENVLGHKYVEMGGITRTPDFDINYNIAIRHPDDDGTWKGPWK